MIRKRVFAPHRLAKCTFACIFIVCSCVGITTDSIAAPRSELTGEQILGHAKAVSRAHVRPPFVAYTLRRRDTVNGLPDFENSYTLAIWCRTSDRNALLRRTWNGRAVGDLVNDTVAFDGYVDPGPPTADIFERALYARPSPSPAPVPSDIKPIGGVVVTSVYDYKVDRVARDGGDWHLWLTPRRDPDRNRIDELWVDAASYDVRRMRVRDHLYFQFTSQSLPDEFDVRFTERDDLPLIATIHGQTREGAYETDYTFENVRFPAVLPDWYFEPKTYGAHRSDAPQ
jgi:hypothetical protein